jgi:aldehyde:ferredoxin oxidoreductase
MAIECYEKGLITREDTGGIELTWGNGEAVLELIQKIAYKKDIGKVFAEGVKKAAEEIGGLAHEYAVHTKGLSYAFHDPRAFTSMAANYATANRGACHLEALSYFAEGGAFPPELIGFNKQTDPHGYQHKGELAARMQNFMNLFNALGLCKFLIRGKASPEIIKNWVNAVTGWNLTSEEFLLIGERLHNLKRMYNVRLGISRKDDTLPPRLLTHDRKTGKAGGSLPHIGRILSDYYEFRGWNPEGIPTKEKLEELGLEELIK